MPFLQNLGLAKQPLHTNLTYVIIGDDKEEVNEIIPRIKEYC